MTDEQREEISRLAKAAHKASEREHWAGYQGQPQDPDAAAEASCRYALIRAEAYEARCALENAISALGARHYGEIEKLAHHLMRAHDQ